MRNACGVVLCLALGSAVACGPSEPDPAPAPEPPAAAPEPASPEPAPPAPAPAERSGEVGAGEIANGAKVYATYCASCHGPGGEGDGPLAASLNPQPAKHSDAAYMDALSDEHLFLVIKEGGTAVGKSPLMAPWGSTLSDAEIRDVVAFTRSLSR